MSLISRLGVVLGLDAGEFNKNLGIAQQRLQGFNQSILGSRLGLAAVATGFVTAAISAVRFADSINDISQASELSVKTVLRLNEALITNGGNAESAAQVINKFSRSIYEANHQNEEMQKNFKALGISMEDLRTKSVESLLFKTIDGFKKLGDAADRTGASFAVIGRSSRNIDWQGVATALEKNKNAYNDAQLAFQEIGNAIDNLNKLSFAMKTGFATNLGFAFQWVTDKAIAYYNTMVKINDFLESKMGKWKFLVPGAAYLPTQKISERETEGKSFSFADQIDREQEVNKDVLKRLKMQQEYYENEKRILDLNTERLKKEAQITGLSDLQTKYLMDQFDYQKKLDDQEQKGLLTAEQKINLLTKFYDYQEQQKETLKAQQTFSAGWSKAYANYVENATNAAKLGEQAFVSVTNNMESALDEFVRTGKLSFSDLARSIISDLIKIQLRAQATSLFSSLGIGDFFSGLFGGGATPAFGSTAFWGGKAEGGNVSASNSYMVGEQGPELFIPNSSGTIIPNNQLSSSLGSGAQVVYNGPYIANMSAIDTQSGLQFLAKNKQGVWAANQSAQRSLPQSR